MNDRTGTLTIEGEDATMTSSGGCPTPSKRCGRRSPIRPSGRPGPDHPSPRVVLYRVFGRSVLALMMLGLDDCEPMANVTFGGETVPIGMPLVEDTAWSEGVVAACMWLG